MSLIFDGTNKRVSVADNNAFSFGNGAGTDVPFSLSAWINMTDATQYEIIVKGDDNATKNEYRFLTSGADKLSIFCYSGASTTRIGRVYNTAITALQGSWIHVAATYSGSKASSGLKLYINGAQVDDTDSNALTYSTLGMPNSVSTLNIGWSAITPTYSNGQTANVSIWNKELSIAEIQSIYYGQGSAEYVLPGCIAFWPMQGLSGAASTTALMDVRGGYNTSNPTGNPVFGDNPLRTDKMGRTITNYTSSDSVVTRKKRIRLFNHLGLLRRSALLGMARRKAIEEKKERI